MLTADLLSILRCPETYQRLSPAGEEVINRLNSLIKKRELRNGSGQILTELLEGGLVREDSVRLYPITKGIVVLLIRESISFPR